MSDAHIAVMLLMIGASVVWWFLKGTARVVQSVVSYPEERRQQLRMLNRKARELVEQYVEICLAENPSADEQGILNALRDHLVETDTPKTSALFEWATLETVERVRRRVLRQMLERARTSDAPASLQGRDDEKPLVCWKS